jgi:hypothetical protein
MLCNRALTFDNFLRGDSELADSMLIMIIVILSGREGGTEGGREGGREREACRAQMT